MENENTLLFQSKDGCDYIYDLLTKQWFQCHSIEKPPLDVQSQIMIAKDKALSILSIPIN